MLISNGEKNRPTCLIAFNEIRGTDVCDFLEMPCDKKSLVVCMSQVNYRLPTPDLGCSSWKRKLRSSQWFAMVKKYCSIIDFILLVKHFFSCTH